jgi:phage baseplate assembly protein W
MDKRQLSNKLKKVTNKDFDLSFRRHPSTGKLLMKKDDEAVKQAVKNLILTNRYERPFRPEYGGDVRRRLFDNFDSIDATAYETQIETAIENYDARVSLDPYSIQIQEKRDQNAMNITIRFKNSLTLNDVALDVNLNRVR